MVIVPVLEATRAVLAAAADTVNSYFTPFHYAAYLGAILVAMIVYYQWKWSKTCQTSTLVLIRKADGHADYELAPQEGGSVSLKNPHSGTTKMWPINELATLDVPYPGVGFIPRFMQKTIRMVLVDEADWEPLLNRSPHRTRVASPDVVEFLEGLATDLQATPENADSVQRILDLIDTLATIPTREMIASPAVLGNLMHEKITEAVITVNKEMLDSVTNLVRRLGRILSSTHFWIGIGALAIGIVVVIVFTSGVRSDLGKIKQYMGIDVPKVEMPAPSP